MSRTPRTDALIASLCPYLDGKVTTALEEHACRLERELAEAKDEAFANATALKCWHEAASPYATPEALKAALMDAACDTCRGSGQICVGTSGVDSDGNAPVMERCPTCGYADE